THCLVPRNCILFLATHLLGDRFNLLNWLGFTVCLSGIFLLVILKAMNSKGDSVLNPFLFLCRHSCSFTRSCVCRQLLASARSDGCSSAFVTKGHWLCLQQRR
uniref:Uncharacterized protein n=1 Tax=Athene cunicularia TaxID=194338 RepID=A0A663NC48_ATHCN